VVVLALRREDEQYLPGLARLRLEDLVNAVRDLDEAGLHGLWCFLHVRSWGSPSARNFQG
jgi:hypothetical protein